MQKVIWSLLFLLITATLFAQVDASNLLTINQNRLDLNRIHAYILGAWALANLTIGGYFTYVLYDGEPESFHHMNASWGLINLGVALIMLYNVNHADSNNYDLAMTIHKHFQTQKLMMLNLGLDITYTLAGVLLREHSKTNVKFSYVLKGFGRSLLLQGLFLLTLDATFYILYSSQNADLYRLLSVTSSITNGMGLIIGS